jgi:hypothetical protein
MVSMPRAHSSFLVLLALSAGCSSDFLSLDEEMSELVHAALPTALEIAAEDVKICPGACVVSSSAHRLDLQLAPVDLPRAAIWPTR